MAREWRRLPSAEEWFDLFQSLETEFGFQPTLLSTSGPRVRAGPVGRELRLKNTMWKRPFRAAAWLAAVSLRN